MVSNKVTWLWSTISKVVIATSLIFFSLFFFLFSLGYHITILEDNHIIALVELSLTVNALIYFIKSQHIHLTPPSKINPRFKYPWILTGALQYVDYFETQLLVGIKHEANPIAIHLWNYLWIFKLITIPSLCIFIQFWPRARKEKYYNFSSLIPMYLMLFVVSWNIL